MEKNVYARSWPQRYNFFQFYCSHFITLRAESCIIVQELEKEGMANLVIYENKNVETEKHFLLQEKMLLNKTHKLLDKIYKAG